MTKKYIIFNDNTLKEKKLINNNKRSNNNIKPNANKISNDNDFDGYLDVFYNNKNNFECSNRDLNEFLFK